MDKAILVIDMPKGCYECPLAVETVHNYDACCITGSRIMSYDKFDWCPLKLAPKPIEVNYGSDEQDWEKGYNSCVEQIMDT